MTRFARGNDPTVALFLDAWDALDVSERSARGSADSVCERVGLGPLDLLRIVAEAAIRFSMCVAQIKAALALPSVVGCSIETALTDKGVADRKMLFQQSGFLPTPKGSQTTIARPAERSSEYDRPVRCRRTATRGYDPPGREQVQ